MNHTLEQIPPALRTLTELRSRAGRDGKVEITLGATVTDPGDLARHAEAGVDRVLVRPWAKSREAIDAIRQFADTVLTPGP